MDIDLENDLDLEENDDQDTGQEIETSKRILDSVLKKGKRKKSESTAGDNEDPQEQDPRFITTNKNFRKVQEEIPRNKRHHHLKNQGFDNEDQDPHVHSQNKKMVRFDPTSEEHNRKYAIDDNNKDIIKKKKSSASNEDKKKKAELVVEKPFYKIAQDLKDRFTFSSSSNNDDPSSSNSIHFFSKPSESTEKDEKDDGNDEKKIKVQKDSQVVNFFAKSFGVGESNFFFLQEDDDNFSKLFKPVEEYFLENNHKAGNGAVDNYYERKEIKKMAKGKVKNFQVKSKKNFRRWRTAQANNKNKNKNNKKRL